MELIDLKNEILTSVKAMQKGRTLLSSAGETLARAISDYDKQLAVTMIQLRNGVTMNLEGNEIENPPTTITEKIAKGICYESKFAVEMAQVSYKVVCLKLDALKVEVSSLQSLLKYFEVV